MNQQYVDYVKDGLSKGYDEYQLKKILLDHGVDTEEVTMILQQAKESVYIENEVLAAAEAHKAEAHKEMNMPSPENQQPIGDVNPKHKLYVSITTISGLILMIVGYALMIIFPATTTTSGFAAIFRGFWPFMFPLLMNIANFIFFRKKFMFGLIISLITIVILVGFVLILYVLGF